MDAPLVATAPARASGRVGVALAGAVGLAFLALVVVAGQPAGVLLYVAYAGTGLVLAVRRPGQPIAWLLMVTGVGFGLGNLRIAPISVLSAGDPPLLDAFGAWANGTGWSLAFIGLTGLALVFPGGTLPRRGRRAAVAIMAASVIGACLVAFGPVINVTAAGADAGTDVPNPFALLHAPAGGPGYPGADGLYTGLFAVFMLAVVVEIARFRRSRGLERLQHRWLAWAVVVVGIANAVWAVVALVLRHDLAGLAWTVAIVSYACIPLAVAVAVLRYRLYEIDRLVSRTLGWALATAAVVGVFVLAVLALQAALSGLYQGETLATAASTLLAFALVQPIRRRAQVLVDRRFDRPRIEAEQTLERHGERLAHEVELAVIENSVIETVTSTIRPVAAGLWIRPFVRGRVVDGTGQAAR